MGIHTRCKILEIPEDDVWFDNASRIEGHTGDMEIDYDEGNGVVGGLFLFDSPVDLKIVTHQGTRTENRKDILFFRVKIERK